LQYAGKGLWGRNYDITGPTEIKYALLPHAGTWVAGQVWRESTAWCEPLQVVSGAGAAGVAGNRSLLKIDGAGWETSALIIDGNDLLLRLFNIAGDNRKGRILFDGRADSVLVEELDGRRTAALPVLRQGEEGTAVELSVPHFGIRTLRLVNAVPAGNNDTTERK
jgi:alpha-mannosidase